MTFNLKTVGIWAIKIFILLGSCYYIHLKLGNIDYTFIETLTFDFSLYLAAIISLLLMIVSWYLEIARWKSSLKHIKEISLRKAAEDVFRGLIMNWVVPFSIGDFIGRTVELPKRKDTVAVVLANRLYSLFVTVCFGIIGLIQLEKVPNIVGLSILIFIGCSLFFLFRIKKVPYPLDFSYHLRLLWLTFSKYLIFTSQVGLIVSFFLPELGYSLIVIGLTIVFLLRSIVPSVLGAIGVREAAMIWVFSPFTENLEALLIASLIVWLINIVLPSILGLIPAMTWKYSK